MKIITALEELHSFAAPCTVALGTFDGLHLGHQDVIGTARDYAKRQGDKLAVFTFSNHPLSLICPEKTPLALVTPEQKYELLEAMGVDVLLDIPFDKRLAELTPADFLENLRPLNYNCLVVGENFSFGYHGEGNSRTLVQSAADMGFKLIVRPLVSTGSTVISSTEIRRLISAGEVAAAARMLGRPYSVAGQVVHGNRRGNLIGFPTANIELEATRVAVPRGGVYAVRATVDGCVYSAMANIGRNPTFGDVEKARLEVNLFDYSGNLYGRQLSVAFYDFIRGERKFGSVAELCSQLRQDKERCQNYFRGPLAFNV